MTYEIACTTYDRDVWLVARKNGIGASDVPIILGATSYGSALEVYAQKCGDEPDPEAIEETEPMLWGKLLEPAIRDEVARRAGVAPVKVVPQYTILRSISYPWLFCTPDGLTEAGEPVEVKAIGYGYDEEEWETGIPEKWQMQCQSQMIVTGAPRCLFGALIFGQRLVWEWITADTTLQNRIVYTTRQLWERIQRRDPPPSDGSDSARRVTRLMANVREAVTELPGELGDTVDDVIVARECEKEFLAKAKHNESLRKAAEDRITLAMGSATRATLNGWTFERRKTIRRGYTVEPKEIEAFKAIPPKEIL